MTDRQGIEIDYCPQCRGIWLDRGELDRLIERSERAAPSPPSSSPRYRDERQPELRGDHHHDARHPKRRKTFLGELFDF